MTTGTGERRRSDRIWLTVPLRAQFAGSNGRMIEGSGRTVNFSRHGAQIQFFQSIDRGQMIRLRNPLGCNQAEFRVVRTFGDRGEGGCECCVECLNKGENFWGIEFPHSVDDSAVAKVLLECGLCHTIALRALSLPETQTLFANDNLSSYCAKCLCATLWWYATISLPWDRRPERLRTSVERQARLITPPSEFVERGHPRLHIQMLLWIRSRHGDSEDVRTKNVSRFGFSFSSEAKHMRGEIVTAPLPLSSLTQQRQMHARIVHEQLIDGSANKIYGARFEPPTGFKPPVA